VFAKALGDIARARGMMQLAKDTGLTREGPYKSLGEQGNPSLSTVMKVIHALGLQMHIAPKLRLNSSRGLLSPSLCAGQRAARFSQESNDLLFS
jgi:hypothetical protein